MASSSQNANSRTIVVGLDFGTTFTGVAYADSHIPDAIHVIQDWRNDKGGMSTTSKVPTKLCYAGDGSFQWGSQVPPHAPHDDVLQYFKLALDPQHTERLQDGSNLTKQNLLGQDIDALVVEYLSSVGEQVMLDLGKKFGPVIVEHTPFLVVVTVPAIWSEVAIERTVKAVTRAWRLDTKPLWKIITLTEPEAAALCVIKQLPKHGLKSNDSIMIVDAGGGTVDLITYRIDTLDPKFKIEEAVAGAGGACGAAFLDERFQQLLVTTLGQEDGFENSMIQGAMMKWERVKRRFSMADISTMTFEFDVTGLADNKSLNVRRSRWRLSGAEVFRIFDGVILQILKLVTDQRAASQVEIKAIVLVGGLGQSLYVRERLQAHMGESIAVLQPGNAWTAVVQGAVMKGLAEVIPEHGTITILNRKARKHLGFELSIPFSPILHSEIAWKKRWDPFRGSFVVKVIQWFIKKEDPVTESEPYFRDFSIISEVNEGRFDRVTLTILRDEASSTAPLEKNDNVKALCVVEADLSHIPDSHIPQRQGNDGLMYYVVNCQIEISYFAASTSYTLLHNGHRYNTVKAESV